MLLRRIYCCLCLSLLAVGTAFSQLKALHAVKTNQPPVIDGSLDDAAWTDLPAATDFIQNFPTYGQPSSKEP